MVGAEFGFEVEVECEPAAVAQAEVVVAPEVLTGVER
jgi:hypothetical protein